MINFLKEFNNLFEEHIFDLETQMNSSTDSSADLSTDLSTDSSKVDDLSYSISYLKKSNKFISLGIEKLVSAWDVCKPKMKESLEAFPEMIYENKN